jgi:hypothetical protein
MGTSGIGTTAPTTKLHVAGGVGITASNVLEFGQGVAGKEVNAGKIGYGTFTTGTLDILGAGTAANSRNVKIWDNVTIPGTLGVSGASTLAATTLSGLLTLNTTGLSADGTTFTATNVKDNLNAAAVMVPTYTGITTAPATTVQFQYG